MKKNSLLKALGITFAIFVVLTWIFPAGTYSGAEYTKDVINPIGLFDLGYYPLITVSAFMQYGIFFLTIGGLYGVLNKIGVHTKAVRLFAEKFENKKTLFMVLSIVLVSLFVSLTGLVMPVMILIPFLYAVMYRLGYSKQSSAAAIMGAIFAGIIGSTVGYQSAFVAQYLSLDVLQLRALAFKAVLYVLVVGLLILYVIKQSKNDLATVPGENRYDVMLYEKTEETSKSITPLVIIMIILGIFVVISMYPWSVYNEQNIFVDIYNKIMGFEIKGFALFKNLLGTNVSPFGYWMNYELATVLIFLSVLIGWIYGVKLGDIVKSFGEGCKKIFSVAFYAAIASVVFSVILNTQTNICFTFINYLSRLTDGFSVPVVSLMTGVSSLFYNDFNYLVAYVTTTIASIYNDTANYSLIAIITQSIYGVVMLFAPVSVALLAGLRMFDVNYKDWIKYMWKYILEIAVIVIVVSLIIFAI